MMNHWRLHRFLASAGIALSIVVGCVQFAGAQKENWSRVQVLVYTKNGKGYVHDNIPYAVSSIQKLGREHGFKVEVTDDPATFTEEKLRPYTLLVFTSTNNDVFDTDAQRLAFRRYIESGGGLVGIHSVVGTERNWRWFKTMLGGTFVWHPPFQKYRLKVIDPAHPSMLGLPKIWEKSDECYLLKEIYPGIRTVLAHDLSTLQSKESEKIRSLAGPIGDLYPAAWHQGFDGGHVWITALGHDKKDYEDPVFVRHIRQGIQFVAGQVQRQKRGQAYAVSIDEDVRY